MRIRPKTRQGDDAAVFFLKRLVHLPHLDPRRIGGSPPLGIRGRLLVALGIVAGKAPQGRPELLQAGTFIAAQRFVAQSLIELVELARPLGAVLRLKAPVVCGKLRDLRVGRLESSARDVVRRHMVPDQRQKLARAGPVIGGCREIAAGDARVENGRNDLGFLSAPELVSTVLLRCSMPSPLAQGR